MKSYIIFTPEITNMGGAQMYTANKVRFLKSKGWNVQVFFPKMKGEILIPELKEFKDNLILEMGIALRFMTKSLKRSIFQKVEKACEQADEIVMESQIITSSFLVEVIARHFGARHIINTIDEQIPVIFRDQNKYFEYKLLRWEFQNADERRLKQIFGVDYKESYLTFENTMVYRCTNVVAKEEKAYSFKPSDYTILSIGRLDKPYIIPMTEEIAAFAANHSAKTINVIYVGGSFKGEFEGIIDGVLKPLPNVNLYMLGYTFPVPISVINATDVAIACANSVNVTADLDVPTIVADMNDYMSVGVYGYDTNNKFYRELEPQVKISSMLDAVLIERKYPRKGTQTNTMEDVDKAFEKELTFIEKSKGNTGYYDVESFISLKTRLISRMVWWKYTIIDPSKIDPRKCDNKCK